ncbi:hypothetical protein ANCCAN_09649 [Ancylostoma caninum]|uniref:Uncharacterized protein n=1 Tax=Ancylostoma caninum TaxID=29170 RepID=A0A368GJ28_ANCCA|nr:hypothetical protein ANCCAN_09649 [Ancylostoma caninum]
MLGSVGLFIAICMTTRDVYKVMSVVLIAGNTSPAVYPVLSPSSLSPIDGGPVSRRLRDC